MEIWKTVNGYEGLYEVSNKEWTYAENEVKNNE